MAVYTNANWLIPRFYKKGKAIRYFALSTILLGILLVLRMATEYKILLPLHQKFYSWTLSHFSFVFITNFLAFSFGALLRVSIDYLSLLRQQEEMKTQQARTELSLLKAQVQPHFLFNTLNNIYYLAYSKDDRTAEVIVKLSDIMRYFVDEAPKELVTLAAELQFIRNYMELEQIRMLHPVKITLDHAKVNEAAMIPPMLLIPLVENIFKHGIDKTRDDNFATISITEENGWLSVLASNRINDAGDTRGGNLGLDNLRRRLEMLFDKNYELITGAKNGVYTASLKFHL
jgi:sensor histidine kinase YesM